MWFCVEAAVQERNLDVQCFAHHALVECIHVVAMHPHLAHDDVSMVVAFDFRRRGPDMLGKVAQACSGGAVGLEDGWVAEEHRDTDGQDERQQPMLRGRSAVGLKSAADGM